MVAYFIWSIFLFFFLIFFLFFFDCTVLIKGHCLPANHHFLKSQSSAYYVHGIKKNFLADKNRQRPS